MGDFPNKDQAYYGYYAQFIHQQNMLQDTVRTNSYHKAIIGNQNLFLNKKVLDVGAGSGILSYFAVQAGASEVYAVEASNMANQIKKILAHNPHLASIMSIFHQSIEKPLPIPKVHTIISEPIGVLIVHERMIESYLHARDNYLAPGGVMIPSSGSIYLAPFSDSVLWAQTNSKVRFWEQDNFFGVDFSCLAKDAHAEIFGQPIVGCFDSRLLMAPSVSFASNYF